MESDRTRCLTPVRSSQETSNETTTRKSLHQKLTTNFDNAWVTEERLQAGECFKLNDNEGPPHQDLRTE